VSAGIVEAERDQITQPLVGACCRASSAGRAGAWRSLNDLVGASDKRWWHGEYNAFADVYKVLKTKIDSGVEPVLDEDHPVVKLLARISDLVMQTLGTTNLGKSTRIAKQASILYRIIHEYLQDDC
jgi:hypothetical protein